MTMNTQDYELTPPTLMGVMLPPEYDPKEESSQELATIPRKIMPVFCFGLFRKHD